MVIAFIIAIEIPVRTPLSTKARVHLEALVPVAMHLESQHCKGKMCKPLGSLPAGLAHLVSSRTEKDPRKKERERERERERRQKWHRERFPRLLPGLHMYVHTDTCL